MHRTTWMTMWRVSALAAGCALAGLVGATAGPAREAQAAAAEMRAGVLLSTKVAVRSRPSRSGRVVETLRQFRPDFRPTTLLVIGDAKDARGARWLRVSLPMRPNGRTGWVPARSLETWRVHRRILVDLSSRTLRVVERGRTRLRTRVAVGKPGAETPVGRFYVTAAFRPKERFYGSWALETSAYSRLSDWPGGGVVGIHGTSRPSLLGQAVSHGCVRVSNTAAQALRRLVRPGTPVQVTR
jgi:lipoprotein-anchoring transpeptidase ErfK/SrfK